MFLHICASLLITASLLSIPQTSTSERRPSMCNKRRGREKRWAIEQTLKQCVTSRAKKKVWRTRTELNSVVSSLLHVKSFCCVLTYWLQMVQLMSVWMRRCAECKKKKQSHRFCVKEQMRGSGKRCGVLISGSPSTCVLLRFVLGRKQTTVKNE